MIYEKAHIKKDDGKVTYWLYYGSRVLTAGRLPVGASEDMVRARAIEIDEAMPLVSNLPYEAPFEFRHKLHYASVRRFE